MHGELYKPKNEIANYNYPSKPKGSEVLQVGGKRNRHVENNNNKVFYNNKRNIGITQPPSFHMSSSK